MTNLWNKFFCLECQEVVDIGHASAEHDDPTVDVYGIDRASASDSGYIASDRDMGHYSPHVWIEVDGLDMCGECGAVQVPEEVIPNEQ